MDAQTSNSIDKQRHDVKDFKAVRMSKLAAMKIYDHACEGGSIEVMGMLVGATENTTIKVYDVYRLPVEGTETRVNAQMESYEFMVQYMNEMVKDSVNFPRKIVGWYHSHPGYNLWLSAIDMQTQKLNQDYQDPYVAVVIDPKKSFKEKKLSIGAFRTRQQDGHPENTTFFELPITITNSEYDKNLTANRLELPTPALDKNMDEHLMRKLIESMEQRNAFDDFVQSSDKKNTEIDNSIYDHFFQKRRNNPKINLGLPSFSSSTSLGSNESSNNDSDTEMQYNYNDTESVTSSLATRADDYNNDKIASNDDSKKSFQRHQFDANFKDQTMKMPETMNNPHGTRIYSCDDDQATQRFSIEESYKHDKEMILALKLQNLRLLKTYRDAFSL